MTPFHSSHSLSILSSGVGVALMSIHRFVDYSQESLSPLIPWTLSLGFFEFFRKNTDAVESSELQEAAGTDDGMNQTGAEQQQNQTCMRIQPDRL